MPVCTLHRYAEHHAQESLLPPLKILWLLLLLVILFACVTAAHAQSSAPAQTPYATLDRQKVTYRGPIHEGAADALGDAAVIGLILPLKGPQEREGRALLEAAQLAVRAEQRRGPLRDGRRLEIAVRDESGPWGQASTEILKLIEEDRAVALVTSANGASAHLAEQIANKISVPILTLSSDPSATQTNVPWLFRVGPSDTDQAQAFCQQIYSELGLRKVLVVAQTDHDGRVGATEFEKAVKNFKAPIPFRFEFAGTPSDLDLFLAKLATTEPDAVVIWTDAAAADALLSIVEATRPSTPVFLCRKAAQLEAPSSKRDGFNADQREKQKSAERFTVDSKQLLSAQDSRDFDTPRTDKPLSLEAEAMYEAVHIIAGALRQIPSNRGLLRNYLANQGPSAGNNVKTPFDPAGNDLQRFSIVQVEAVP